MDSFLCSKRVAFKEGGNVCSLDLSRIVLSERPNTNWLHVLFFFYYYDRDRLGM